MPECSLQKWRFFARRRPAPASAFMSALRIQRNACKSSAGHCAALRRTKSEYRQIQRTGSPTVAHGAIIAMVKKPAPSLESKKDLILHTYDSFLVNQTRLFVQARSNEESDSPEINRRRELLLLDDLMGFAIAARRMVELTGLKSFANRCVIPIAFLDRNEEPHRVIKFKEKTVGFHTLMNRLIHASIIEHVDNMLDLVFLVEGTKLETRKKILMNRIISRKYDHPPMEQLLFVSTEDMNAAFFSINDMIQQSIGVAEKVVELCGRHEIFLELDMRGAD
jgi:hypothetical protein